MNEQKLAKTYQKLTHREQILLRPDSYIGSIENESKSDFIFDGHSMIQRDLVMNPGLLKIIDEIIVNARDHHIRQPKVPVTKIIVSVCQETGKVTVYNNGSGIPVQIHPEHKVYVPELIFGHLLTSTNYDDSDKRIVGGKNGYGAKLTNIFSVEFTVKTLDTDTGYQYSQTFANNMQNIEKPTLTKSRSKTPFTEISFTPDYAKFGMTHLTQDMFDLIQKRTYDLCACTGEKVSVVFNDTKLEYKNFEKYVDLYLGPKTQYPRVYESPNERWEVIATYSDSGFQQVSFVNGINTTRGGRHVDTVVNQISKKLVEWIKLKKKKTVRQADIKSYLSVFINATIENPVFDGQTKETLQTPATKFGSKCELSEKFMEKLYKSGIIERAIRISDFNESKELSKLGGTKKIKILVDKLEDANKAGGRESSKCTLIVTEGDSAKAMAVDGVSEVDGRDYYGIFPLKGKPLNVKDASPTKIASNAEISNIMKILGLQVDKKNVKSSDLRYGRLMILSDADDDGIHIKGLIMNLIHSMWPSLVKDGFIVSMLTPVVKATRKGETKSFYTLSDFQKWRSGRSESWKVKYYKGLGTSTGQEAREYFRIMKLVNYEWNDLSASSLDLAFNKKRADDRKEWLRKLPDSVDYQNIERMSYDSFVNNELIRFSTSDNVRSIPSMVDGLKPSTRKILYGCIKRNLWSDEIRVSQLAGYISEHADYHHGEASLHGAIINMAQTFVGSNNINLLYPSGQFGSRLQAGKDAASPRYIHTKLCECVKLLFRDQDFPVLKRAVNDDNEPIEPVFYVPIIPMILVNGSVGIGTGYSTSVPCFNPSEVAARVKLVSDILKARGPKDFDPEKANKVIDSIELADLSPWYKGFTGDIIWQKNSYASRGVYKAIDSHTIEITELPIGTWTDDYKKFLETLMAENKIVRDFKYYHSTQTVKFIVTLLSKADSIDIYESLNLISNKGLSISNMHLYDAKGYIKKYDSVVEIIKDFCKVRYEIYGRRKAYLLEALTSELRVLDHKIRFVLDVINGRVKVMNQKTRVIMDRLAELHYDADLAPDLVRLPISSLTWEKKTELEDLVSKKRDEFNLLKKTREPELWSSDLKEFSLKH